MRSRRRFPRPVRGRPAVGEGRLSLVWILLLASGVLGGCTVKFERDFDADKDGVDAFNDCNDQRADVYPGALERCGDGIDQDCSGADSLCSEVTPTLPPGTVPSATPSATVEPSPTRTPGPPGTDTPEVTPTQEPTKTPKPDKTPKPGTGNSP